MYSEYMCFSVQSHVIHTEVEKKQWKCLLLFVILQTNFCCLNICVCVNQLSLKVADTYTNYPTSGNLTKFIVLFNSSNWTHNVNTIIPLYIYLIKFLIQSFPLQKR